MKPVTAVFEPFEINGVLRLRTAGASSAGSDTPGPHVAITGSVHGNEPCGMRAMARLSAELQSGELSLRHGTLYLVHGNPRASALGERHTPDGADLNRLFDYRFEVDLPSAFWAYEHYRALELKPLLQRIDALLDLHSTTAPAPPFGIVSPLQQSCELAAALGLGYITQGWDGPGLLADRVIIAPLTRRGVPAVSVECGQHADESAVEVAYGCIRRALDHLGMLAFVERDGRPETTWLTLRAAVKRPSAGFKFVQPLRSMQQLEEGDVIGRDQDLTLTVNRRCFLIMPNDDVAVGEDMVYIAQRSE